MSTKQTRQVIKYKHMEKSVRVRFAPSPTGPLHIGGVRTALFNYLFAKKNDGTFIVRIEDTDQTRWVAGAEEYIMEALEWCGLNPDESPVHGGEYGAYRQSERKDVYQKYVLQLLESGHAYYAFDTAEELEKMREDYKSEKLPSPQYNAILRTRMRNSLTLSKDEVDKLLSEKVSYTIRLKVDPQDTISFQDLIRGRVKTHASTLDDKVLMKSDGLPTYHLANVVDDYLMKISHVIRGEEWIPSTPTHVLLYKYLGLEDEMPQFVHLPLILKPSGNGKLSKRDGEKFGFPVYPMSWKDEQEGSLSKGFREEGFIAEAFVNFLALIGWNPKDEQEIFSLQELIKKFSIEAVHKAGAKFDYEKAKWFNQQYLKKQSNAVLLKELKKVLEESKVEYSHLDLEGILDLMKERVTFLSEIPTKGNYFFNRPSEYDSKTLKKKWKEDSATILEQIFDLLAQEKVWKAEPLKEKVMKFIESHETSMGGVFPILRLSLTGEGGGPDLFKIIEILGKQEVEDRIKYAVEKLP